MSAKRLLLFDIDGTLLDTGGVGLRSLKQGFIDAFDLAHREAEFPRLDLAGTTDGSIVNALFKLFEVEQSSENVERFFVLYHSHLEDRLAKRGPNEGRRLPGARRLLNHLQSETEHVLGLLTGNIARGAFTKVAAFGMPDFFEFGAFGDDHHDRNALGPIAMDRAADKFGTHFESESVFIIGDTPKDIACARACGAVSVAVATGAFSAEQLEELEPDILIKSFESDADAFLDSLS